MGNIIAGMYINFVKVKTKHAAKHSYKRKWIAPTGFEPVSPPPKGGMIGRYIPQSFSLLRGYRAILRNYQ
jgi:hypothetical protein